MKMYKRLAGGQRPHNHSNNLMMMRGGMKTIRGMAEAGAKAGTIGRLRLGATPSQRTTPRLCRRGMETQNSFDDFEFDVLMYKIGSNPGDHCFLVPRLISGLTGGAREHLRMAGDLDRFAVDGGLEQILEYSKTQMCIRRPQEEGMAFKKYIYEIKRAKGESMTSWINRSDEALMDMRKKLATAPGANSSESTMIPPQIQGWLLLHRASSRDQDIVGVMTRRKFKRQTC